jgi:hypothetical protein
MFLCVYILPVQMPLVTSMKTGLGESTINQNVNCSDI